MTKGTTCSSTQPCAYVINGLQLHAATPAYDKVVIRVHETSALAEGSASWVGQAGASALVMST